MTDKEKLEAIRAEIHRLVDVKGYDREMANDLFAFMNSLPNEPVSDELEEACDSYYDETWDEHGGRAMVIDGCHDIWFPSHATDDFFKAGAKWQKEYMIAKAIDAHCFGFQGAALFSFRLPASNYLVGSEVKVIVIKED